MTAEVASDPVAASPRERGWRWFLVALALLAAANTAPRWTPALALVGGVVRLLLPIEQVVVLTVVAVAACYVVGWWAGGRFTLALGWIGIAGWMLWQLPFPVAGYGAFVRGWSLSLGAAFGLVCLVSRSRPFLSRALTAVAVAAAVAFFGMALGSSAETSLTDGSRMVGREYQRRVSESVIRWQQRTASPSWEAFAARMPSAAARAERLASVIGALGTPGSAEEGGSMRSWGPLAVLSPALLALESLLALALGWAAYHRLARVRIGPPLAPLREVRFNDQLVWGLVAGTTVFLLPTLAEWRALGANLTCFFGTLYALRGAGVLTWWMPNRVAVVATIGLLVLAVVLGPIQVLFMVLLAMFILGLGDTWRDFRADAGVRRPGSLR